jgi:hypothetical protein
MIMKSYQEFPMEFSKSSLILMQDNRQPWAESSFIT